MFTRSFAWTFTPFQPLGQPRSPNGLPARMDLVGLVEPPKVKRKYFYHTFSCEKELVK